MPVLNAISRESNVFLLRIIISLPILLIFLVGSTIAVPANPTVLVNYVQPDGTTITIRPVGDELTGRMVTPDGYTVVRDDDDWIKYAKLSNSGRLIPTDMRVVPVDKRTLAESIRLKEIPKYLQELSNTLSTVNFDENANPVFPLFMQTSPIINNVLMILIKFPDEDILYQPPAFDDLMNQPDYSGVGSINDYFEEVSYGWLGINGNVVGWYEASNPRAYYAHSVGNNWVAYAELARDAILAADTDGLDFSNYDNDGDGVVDGIFIVHAGPGAENGYSDYPWSHVSSLEEAGLGAIYTDGVKISGYSMEPEKHDLDDIVHIGVFCHEYGHILGLPDLYDIDYSSIGIGQWCVMSGGTWNGPFESPGTSPAHLSAWCKIQKGWVTPINVFDELEKKWIPEVEIDPVIYRLWDKGTYGQEYFLIEYRRQMLFDQYLPGCGLAIWHIDESVDGNRNDAHRMVDLEECDGTENNSEDDLFLYALFDDVSNPNSRTYDSTATNVSVRVISRECTSGGTLTTLSTGVGPCDSLVDYDNDGLNDCEDNCRFIYNPDQTDENNNDIGDACEDSDGDGVVNTDDNCINIINYNQADWDSDGIGDVCDDFDGDGVMDAYDNCLIVYNPDQIDLNGNGIGDACDSSDYYCGQFTFGYTGNTDCSEDGKRDLTDITRLIDRIYISKLNLCCEENGNTNGDIENIIDLADIARLIDHIYISKTETAACE